MKILIDVPVHEPAFAELCRRPECRVERLDPPAEHVRELEPDRIRDVDVCVCTFPPANHREMTRLKWIQLASTGYAQVVGHGLAERGVRVTNARGCFDVPIAEWTIAMMINLARDCRQMIRNQEAAIWDRSAIFQNEIRGRVVGIWGYGGIGRETARVARLLGLRVHVMTRRGRVPRHGAYTVPGTGDPEGEAPHRVFGAGEEAEFLRDLDFLVVALPLTDATRGLVGERELRALPPRAFLLNPARGPIVAEEALLRALREKWIAGAALDTHYRYPMPPDHPLWRFPNVILTPHISGSSLGPRFPERLWEIVLANVDRFSRHEPLLNELLPAELAGA